MCPHFPSVLPVRIQHGPRAKMCLAYKMQQRSLKSALSSRALGDPVPQADGLSLSVRWNRSICPPPLPLKSPEGHSPAFPKPVTKLSEITSHHIYWPATANCDKDKVEAHREESLCCCGPPNSGTNCLSMLEWPLYCLILNPFLFPLSAISPFNIFFYNVFSLLWILQHFGQLLFSLKLWI